MLKPDTISRFFANPLHVELAATIEAKVNDSYIYYLRYRAEHDTSLFNVMLEVGDPDAGKVTRLLAALEYRPEEGLLKLVTLY